jgi:outer membrane protein assembly factor BamA
MRIRKTILMTLALLALTSQTSWAESDVDAGEQEPFISATASHSAQWCSDDSSCVVPVADAFYNRVDGLLFYMGARYRSESHLHPRLKALRGWHSARGGASYYEIDVEQPVFGQDSFAFGVSFYDRTAWSREDADNITDVENNLFAVLLRQEQRDYYREDGYSIFARQEAGPHLSLGIEYRDAELSSLCAAQSVWSVFRQDAAWRENPQLQVGILDGVRAFEGRMKSYEVSFTYDTREGSDRQGWLARGSVEDARKSAGGDYEYRRVSLDLGRKLRITDTQTLALRGAWGIGSGTDFPSHRLFYLGGLGTLRGYDYRAFVGKNLFFASAEYGVRVRQALELIYFVDSGEVWYGTSGFDWDDLKKSMGIGVRFEAPGVGDVRVDVARPMTTEDADTIVSLRLVFPS